MSKTSGRRTAILKQKGSIYKITTQKFKKIDRKNQDKTSKVAMNLEQKLRALNKMDSIEMANYWKRQQRDTQKLKEMEKIKDIEDGKRYIKWVNEFSDNYNHERLKVYEKGTRRASKSPHNHTRLLNSNSTNMSELKSSGLSEKDLSSNISINNKPERIYEDIFKNDFTSGKVLREKFKNKYIKDLNQQLEEKKIQKQRENLMDQREKVLNQKYITDLKVKRNIDPNPILSTSHLKIKFDRNNSHERMNLDNRPHNAHESSLDGYYNDQDLMLPNRSKSNIKLKHLDIISPSISVDRKDNNISRIVRPQRKLIMNTGNNVMRSVGLKQGQINRTYDNDSLLNYHTIHRRKNKLTLDSFGRLGFKDNTKNDPNFNVHHEYNLRKLPIRKNLNSSADNIRIPDFKPKEATSRTQIHVSNKASSIEDQIKQKPQVDNITRLVFGKKQ